MVTEKLQASWSPERVLAHVGIRRTVLVSSEVSMKAYPATSIAAICGALLSTAGCHRATREHPPPVPVAGCPAQFSVAVSRGVTPQFTWTADCTVSSVAVQESIQTKDHWKIVWSYHIPDSDGVGSGIAYGSAPLDAVVTIGAQPLRRGRYYLVTLRKVVRGSIVAEGEAAFRP
jgi:hypothetical protein